MVQIKSEWMAGLPSLWIYDLKGWQTIKKEPPNYNTSAISIKADWINHWGKRRDGFIASSLMQTCHFDLTQILNECEKKSEFTEKNLNSTTKIAFLYRNLYQIQSPKNLNLSQFIWISLNFRGEKIWMIQIKSEWMAGLYNTSVITQYNSRLN